jgi:glycine/D-amino acid oxidase-like deaminating enzyme
MPNFKQLSAAELPQGVNEGYAHTTIMINAPMYLQYLLHRAQELGATTLRATLPSTGLQEALAAAEKHIHQEAIEVKISAFVNATGLSASHLVPDPNVYPIRGLTVLVEGSALKCTTVQYGAAENDPSNIGITYILPRPRSNTTVIGGTKQSGSWKAEAHPGEADEILKRAKEFAPELVGENGGFKVLSSQAGLRPGRKGGARVEIDITDERVVCHAYGHSGAGKWHLGNMSGPG